MLWRKVCVVCLNVKDTGKFLKSFHRCILLNIFSYRCIQGNAIKCLRYPWYQSVHEQLSYLGYRWAKWQHKPADILWSSVSMLSSVPYDSGRKVKSASTPMYEQLKAVASWCWRVYMCVWAYKLSSLLSNASYKRFTEMFYT